jgi:hypothetical protein
MIMIYHLKVNATGKLLQGVILLDITMEQLIRRFATLPFRI